MQQYDLQSFVILKLSRMVKRTLTALLFFLTGSLLSAQNAGTTTYNFLKLTNSARVAALGGSVIAIQDNDLNFVFHNPALLSEGMDQNINLNYIDYFAGVNYGYASYAFKEEGIGNFAAGIHYVDYGQFTRYDEYGVYQGTFRASEYALNLIGSRTIIDTFLTVGVNIKPVLSVFEQYTSFGIVMDLGAVYYNPHTLTTVGLVIRNFGTQITTYAGEREKVPFEIQAGFSQRLEHAPFRFSVILQQLQKWDLTYPEESDSDYSIDGQDIKTSKFDIIGDQLMRHVIFGAEFLPGKNFHVDLGYNYRRRQELKADSRYGMVGFSWGFGFRVSKFHFAFGHATYHLAGGTNHFSITTNLSDFYKKL